MDEFDRMRERRGLDGRYLLCAILLMAAFLRIVGIGRESFWYDEAVTAELAAQSTFDLLTATAEDGGNPQGFWLLAHWWRSIVGDSDEAMRCLSAFLGLLGIVAVYSLAKTLVNQTVATASAFLLAVNPGHILL